MIIVAIWKVTLVGLLGVGAIVYTSITAVPCPRKYQVGVEDGGVLQNRGDIVRYCKLDYDARWILKEEFIKKQGE
tara:strand:- start:808 stop:1032 length:225 start_codon:yes stop_codon:yes gene_type:complete